MARKATWCFTIESAIHEPTGENGVPVQYNSSFCTLVVGPIESPDSNTDYPHQHGYIQCLAGAVLTKGQAASLLKEANCYKEDMYLHELETTRAKYHSYCFKNNSACFTSAERAIKRAMESIENDQGLKITSKRLKHKLATSEGPSFVAKNKQVIDVVLSTPDLKDNGKHLNEEVDVEENLIAYTNALTEFRKIIKATVKKNGIVTTHPAFNNASRKDQARAILCLAVLPQLVFRARITDGLPGLWFHGRPHCGKSYLFSQIPCYKKVPTDAEGVSRFKLEGEQSAWLLDDVDSGWLLKPSNSKTLKALAIGEREMVKTMGDTQEVRGFVVLTSNCVPDHLSPLGPTPENVNRENAEKDHEFNCNAWKRRLVSLYFDEPVEYQPVYVDFDVTSLDMVARKAFENAYEHLESNALKSLFAKYYNHICGQWTEKDLNCINNLMKKLSGENE